MKVVKVDDLERLRNRYHVSEDGVYFIPLEDFEALVEENSIEVGWQDLTDENMPDEGVEVTLRTKASPLYVDTLYKGRWGRGYTPEQILILPEEGTE